MYRQLTFSLHSSYGLALGFVAARERDDRLLLTAVSQINHGGPQSVIDEEQAVVVVELGIVQFSGEMCLDEWRA
jgi:hypothetical protein